MGSLHDAAQLNRLCNDLGQDTIEAGNTPALLIECGLIKYGDGPAAIKALKEDYNETSLLGRLVCSGTLTAGENLGVTGSSPLTWYFSVADNTSKVMGIRKKTSMLIIIE
ncbi:hypothetical protein EU527_05495 [Candidatus Thorarchaeota archaeon]|nr:MAG: hypothetical protein EU527_05495 [Candidatus Thorarchaeota archaeon]